MLIVSKVSLLNALKNISEGPNSIAKKFFFKQHLFFTAREKVLGSFENRLFPKKLKPELETEPKPELEPEPEPEHKHR